ncbi:MAG: dienelactone hydrolase family protein [Myxococcaceae bacterium]
MLRRVAPVLLLLPWLGCGPPPPDPFTPAPTQVKTTVIDELSAPFFSAPWPDDRRLREAGTINTRRFPNPGKGSMMETVLVTGDHLVKGFGLSSPIYLPFTGGIDPASLPPTPTASLEDASAILLVAIDPASAAYGRRVPLQWHFYDAPTLFLPGNVLAVRPVPGFPLEPKTRYALLVTSSLKDGGGTPVGPEEELWRALGPHQPPSEAAAHYAALNAFLDEQHLPRGSIAGATVFTTQPILDELLVLRDWLRAQPAPAVEALAYKSAGAGYLVFEGTYPAPNLQHGEVPYATSGGEFRYDEAGVPIPAKVEDMRVAFAVPWGPAPPGGFPVVLYSHGTGGSYRSFIRDVAEDLAGLGVASFGIDQVMHGPRAPPGVGCFGQDVEICFFNPVNVVAGRNNARQAGLDNFMLRKLIEGLVVPAAVHPQGLTVRFDTTRLGFFGHSQGGFSGAPYLAAEDSLAAAVVSGTGGLLTDTVLVRKDPIDLRALAEGPLLLNIEGKESLDEFHPALALTQTLGDIADPLSYARYWVKRPQGAAKNLYLTNGLLDPYTPASTAEAMAAAAGVPQMLPVGRDAKVFVLAGLPPLAPPVRGNAIAEDGGAAVTALFRQFPGQGHFPVFDDDTSRKQWREFFESALAGGAARIPAP